MGFWAQLGVSGFRMDAVPFVISSKDHGDGIVTVNLKVKSSVFNQALIRRSRQRGLQGHRFSLASVAFGHSWSKATR
jgi:glycosidase